MRKFEFIPNAITPHHYRIMEVLKNGNRLLMGSVRLYNDHYGTIHKFTVGKWYFVSAFDFQNRLHFESDTLEEIKAKVIEDLGKPHAPLTG